MKRAGILGLALWALLALTACGGGNTSKQAPTGGGAVPDTEAGTGGAGGSDSADGAGGGSDSADGAGGGTGAEETGTPDSGVTIQKLLDANRTEALLSSRGSFLMETDYDPQIDVTGQVSTIYADSENVYLQTDATHELYTNHGCYVLSDGYFGTLLLQEPVSLSSFAMIMLDEETTSLEEITGVERDGDTLTLHTVLSAEAIAGYFGEELESDAYAAGDSTEITYTLDPADLAVLACSTVLRHGDGSTQDVGTMRVTYGADLPENGVILREHLDAPDRRTVTMVLDPGTEEETSFSVTAQRGDRVFPYLTEGYYVCYTDPACTVEYDEAYDLANLENDLTLYAPRLDLAEMLEAFDLAGHGEDAEWDMDGEADPFYEDGDE